MYGLVWVIQIDESLKSITARILKKGAIPVRPFHIDFLNFRPKAPGVRSLWLFHHSEFPFSSFLISSPSPTTGKQAKCITDRGFDLILPKLKAGLEPEYSGYFESNGMEYKHNDFNIRVGVASMANSTSKGTTVEVEFISAAHAECGIGILIEYMEALVNDGIKRYPMHLKDPKFKKEIYSPLDTMQQYKHIFTEMRNRTTSSSFNS